MAFIVRVFIDGKETTHTVNEKTFTIGRSTEAGVTLSDARISRSHLTVTVRDNKVWIEDSGSTNGTLVNNRKIQGKNWFQIEFSDRIKLGTSPIEMEIDLVDAAKKAAEVSGISAQFPITPEMVNPVPINISEVKTKDKEKEKEKPRESKLPSPPPTAKVAQPAPVVAAAASTVPPVAPPASEVSKITEHKPILPAAKSSSISHGSISNIRLPPPAPESSAEADKVLQLKEQIIGQAKAKADELRQSARQEAEEIEKESAARVQAMRKEAHDEYELILARARKEGELERAALLEEAKSNLEVEKERSLKKARDQVRSESQGEYSKLEKCKKETVEVEKILQELNAKKSALEKESADIQRNLNEYYEDLNALKIKAEQAKAQTTAVMNEKAQVEEKYKVMQERLSKINLELDKQVELKDTQIRNFENELISKKIKLEEEFANLKKNEEKELRAHQEEEVRQWKKIKEQMMNDLFSAKNSLAKDLSHQVEKLLATDLSAEKLRTHVTAVRELVETSIDDATASMASRAQSDNLATRTPVVRKKNMGTEWAIYAAVLGAVTFWAGEQAYQYVQHRKTPMTDSIETQAAAKKKDLEDRKFNPAQTHELKENYVDAVIYTRGYGEKYLSDDFQKKLFLAASAYFLQQWKVPEEKTVQAVSANASLVQTLFERKGQIHPDFVKDGVQKMRQLESESAEKVKEILGSQVKQQALARFERKFYQDYVFDRAPAQQKKK